nr:ribosomal RNA small subunit methyltransferase nep-1-like [Coffea arabica]
MRKKNMNPYDYRPDIIHEVLVDILGSRLNMAGMVKAVYVKTDQRLLIRIEPHINIPPTPGKFCSLMSELLQKFTIKARGKGEKLMRLIANPLDKHLPLNSLKIGLSFSSSKAVNLRDYVTAINNDCTLVFTVWSLSTD